MIKNQGNFKYSQTFTLQKNKLYVFPNFILEYIEDYKDITPANALNKKSSLYRGRILLIKSENSQLEIKESFGEDIKIPKTFEFENKTYYIKYLFDKDKKVLLRSIHNTPVDI